MLSKQNPTQTTAWKALQKHFAEMEKQEMKQLFADDPSRFQQFSLQFEDLLVDFSKNRITAKTLELLLELAEQTELPANISALFNGEAINETEGRSVLHMALRNRSNRPITVGGKDVMPDVNRVLDQMDAFVGKVLSGDWKGYQGQKNYRYSQYWYWRFRPRGGDGHRSTKTLLARGYSISFCFECRWN
jgi:glucose-6-phosphate isomerase